MTVRSVRGFLARRSLATVVPVSAVVLAAVVTVTVVASHAASSGQHAGDDRLVSAAGPVVGSSPTTAPVDTVTCEELPSLVTASEDIAYDPTTHIVQFGWGDGTYSKVLDTEPGCASQPRFEEELRGLREGAVASERASCRELQYLVDAVRAERRSNGESTTGPVPVSDAAQAEAARRNGSSVELSVEKRRQSGGLLDLDQADRSLAECPR
jgi:hypothetical protein